MDLSKVNGYKTYIVMVAAICYALGGVVAGFHDWNATILIILTALGIGGVRNAITKPEVKPEVPSPGSMPQ